MGRLKEELTNIQDWEVGSLLIDKRAEGFKAQSVFHVDGRVFVAWHKHNAPNGCGFALVHDNGRVYVVVKDWPYRILCGMVRQWREECAIWRNRECRIAIEFLTKGVVHVPS